MDDRMKIMKEIKDRTKTHDCPQCDGPAYCAMEDGKSINNCWCYYVENESNPMIDYNECLCYDCMIKKS